MTKLGLVLLCQVLVGLCILSKMQELQNEPYMDEIFHIPQAKQYCHGNLSVWDPMITTLPGLYLSSVSLLAPTGMLLQLPVSSVCNSFTLRGINLGFMSANVIILYLLSCVLNSSRHKVWSLLNAVSIGFFPVLYFISFLYYTDPGSVFCVLMMYLSCLKHAHFTAALCGLAAVLFRQTNIVWVLFLAGLACERDVIEWLTSSNKHVKVNICSVLVLRYVIKHVINSFANNHQSVCYLLKTIVQKVIPYLLVVVMFIIFVFLNNGIVVGDKSHHQACFNFPQVYYFLCTALVFGCWHLLSVEKITKCFNFIIQYPFTVSLFALLSAYIIANFTHVHEYLLADNRHYSFYVWSKIYRRHEMVKFLLIPLYFFAYFNFSMSLKHKTFFWKILFAVCVSVSLVPQKLLEFRYFVIPYLIWRLNIQPPSRLSLWLEMLSFNIINGVTFFIFFLRPFKWPDSEGHQRFMW